MIHFSVFLVTAIGVTAIAARFGDVVSGAWRALAILAVVAPVSLLAIYLIAPAAGYRMSAGAQSTPPYIVDLALGGIAGFVGGSWITVHRALRSPAMLGDEWLAAFESRYRFLTVMLATIVAVQLVIPHLELWLSSATGVEVAGLIKLQMSPATNQSTQSNTAFSSPSTQASPSEVNLIEQALDAVINVADIPQSLRANASATDSGAKDCLLKLSICDDWAAVQRAMTAGPGGALAPSTAYTELPMILRDLAQISFLASNKEAGFSGFLKDAIASRESQPWFNALRDNYLLFDHMNGFLTCVKTYSRTVRDLRLQLLDSHELVRGLTLLSSNPMGLWADAQTVWPRSGRTSANAADNGFAGEGTPLRRKELQALADWAIGLVSDKTVKSVMAIRDRGDLTKRSRDVLSQARRLMDGLDGTPINHDELRDALDLAERDVELAAVRGTTGDEDGAVTAAKQSVNRVIEAMRDRANVIGGFALVPWQRVVRRVDQSLTDVFERASNELWVYGQGSYRDYESWAQGAGPMPITEGSNECGYRDFDLVRNSLIRFLGGGDVGNAITRRNDDKDEPRGDLIAVENIARSLEFAPYVTLAAANLFAGIGGRDSGVSLLTRWLDQVPLDHWKKAVKRKEISNDTANAADVWLRVRAFSGLNHILEEDDRNLVNGQAFAQLLQDTTTAISAAKPDVQTWFDPAKCAIESESLLYRSTAQFFYFYFMTLRIRVAELSGRPTTTNDPSREVFITDKSVEELTRYMDLPDLCLSTVVQFTGQGDGWRGAVGVTLAQHLARRGLSKQWAGSEAGTRNQDVIKARRLFVESEARLAKAVREYDRRRIEEAGRAQEAAEKSQELGLSANPGRLEGLLLSGQNPWKRYLTVAREAIDALGDLATPR